MTTRNEQSIAGHAGQTKLLNTPYAIRGHPRGIRGHPRDIRGDP